MKRMTLAATAAITLTVLAGGAAVAQQATQQADRATRADTDQDGRISQSEFVQARVGRLTAVDANRDGAVSAEEIRSGIDTRRNQRTSARFERLDKDGNGNVSRDEFLAAGAARAEHGARHARRGRGQGGLTAGAGGRHGAPLARGPVAIADVQTRSTEAFARLDADHDGYLTPAERQTARQHWREGRQAGRAERMARHASGSGSPSPLSAPSE